MIASLKIPRIGAVLALRVLGYELMVKGARSIPLNINSHPDQVMLNVDFCRALTNRVKEFLLGLIFPQTLVLQHFQLTSNGSKPRHK